MKDEPKYELIRLSSGEWIRVESREQYLRYVRRDSEVKQVQRKLEAEYMRNPR